MKRVIERCPNCGVEHDTPVGGACEVCGTPLRFWCRVHSREIGWLDGPECPRCAGEAAARRPAPPRPRPPVEAPPRAEAPRRRPPIVVEPDPTEWDGPPARAERYPPPGRDPREVLREGAEALAPHVATGGRVAVRMIHALVVLVRSVIGWGFFGAVAGGAYAYFLQADILWSALFGAMVGGGAGLLVGAILALRVLFASPPRRDV